MVKMIETTRGSAALPLHGNPLRIAEADPASRGEAQRLSEEAARCRRLAANLTDPRTVQSLLDLARECDAKAQGAAAPEPEPAPTPAPRPA
jgi:hypothetical protein